MDLGFCWLHGGGRKDFCMYYLTSVSFSDLNLFPSQHCICCPWLEVGDDVECHGPCSEVVKPLRSLAGVSSSHTQIRNDHIWSQKVIFSLSQN